MLHNKFWQMYNISSIISIIFTCLYLHYYMNWIKLYSLMGKPGILGKIAYIFMCHVTIILFHKNFPLYSGWPQKNLKKM